MNTSQLKRFAKEARIKLINQVGRKLEFVLTHDTAELRGKQNEIAQLKQKIQEHGKDHVIETAAYTWFNRLMALRFMDANGYTIPKIVTPLPGMTNPEVLQNALAGNIEEDLKVDRQRINDLLDGRTANADAHTEAYKMLLVAVCNYWHTTMPFMFERISDYTELLLPDDLLSDYSIVADIRNGMSDDDCRQEELIGWLYQFYISDKKDEVFNGLKKNIKITAENIPAATQLFTPRWIVRYMVENTLGKLWLTFKPDSNLRQYMPYFIEAPEGNLPAPLPEGIKGIADITFLDPCQGSGHVLVYAFDLFTKIYEEEGYNISEIPGLILKNNVFGIDIDERAAQLSAFALTMKARSYYTRFLRKPQLPNIISLKNIKEEIIEKAISLPTTIKGQIVVNHKDLTINLLAKAENYGSLIMIEQEEIGKIELNKGSIWQRQLEELKNQATYLSRQYFCVVTNPPYMGAGGMNSDLKQFLESKYPKSKSDLMTAFMERALSINVKCGYWGMINLPSWMFLGTFEKFRKKLIDENFIESMLHLGRGIFGSDFGSVAFTLQNRKPQEFERGIYRRVFKEHVQVRTVEVIKQLFFQKDYGFFIANQREFRKTPGSPIGYWVKNLSIFENNSIGDEFVSGGRNKTHNNVKYIRLFWEIANNQTIWKPYANGGDFRKFYGNNLYLVNWGEGAKSFYRSQGGLLNQEYWGKEGITWNLITASINGFRIKENDFIYSSGSPTIFNHNFKCDYKVLGFLNTKVSRFYLKLLNPSVNTTVNDVLALPLLNDIHDNVNQLVESCINISKSDWDAHEISWNFSQNELVKHKEAFLKKAFELYNHIWSEKFHQLRQNEEELNDIFIKRYNLESELSNEVPIQEITILQEESIVKDNRFSIDPAPVLLQLISYSVGCKFGRFSVDKPGYILFNQGETLEDFLIQIPVASFMPDDDNIIPILDAEWFSDDIVGIFKMFLSAAFEEESLVENLKFIENTIGKDIRKYFVKDFYNDHIKRYKKRPIYWMFSSPKGHFKALIYMHRYQPDLCSKMLNDYLQPFINKLEGAKQSQTMFSLREDISAREKASALKEIDRMDVMLKDCREYERTLFTVATQKITIDLDDGVKVNYQKFKDVLVPIKGLEKEDE